jgi:hypothetical protein
MRSRRAHFLPTPFELLSWGFATVGLLCVAFVTWFWLSHASDQTPGDTHNYILAGLRLNVGHPLYTYAVGDERSVPVNLADTYALLSPPLIGVVFRLIVLLPAHGQYIWWVSTVVLELAAAIALVRRAPLITGMALVPLSVAIGLATEVGNVDCLVLPGLLLAWYWMVHGHYDRAAVAIALLASLKLTPVIFVWWLFVTGRRRAAGVAIASGLVLGLVAILGTEPLIFVKFFEITMGHLSTPWNGVGPAGLAAAVGLPAGLIAWLPRAILVTGVAAMWATRRRPGVSWALGAILMWLVSPVASLHTPALVLVAIAPLAWPMAREALGDSVTLKGSPNHRPGRWSLPTRAVRESDPPEA